MRGLLGLWSWGYKWWRYSGVHGDYDHTGNMIKMMIGYDVGGGDDSW